MILQEVRKKVLFEFTGLPIVMLDDRTIYHTHRKKIIPEKLNCRSLGYWIDRKKFLTKSKLNSLSVRSDKSIVITEVIDCPF